MATQKGGKAAKSRASGSRSSWSKKPKPAAKSSGSSSSSKPKAQATLRGRFSPGTKVALVQVSGPEQLRPAGGKTLARKKVGEDGMVRFTQADGVEVGGRYFISGYQAGSPLDIRVTGKSPEDDAGSVGAQQPVMHDEVKTFGQPRAFPERGQRLPDPPPHRFVDEDGKTHTAKDPGE